MFKWGKIKQKYVRFRKRRLFVYIVTFVLLFSIGTAMLAWIGIFGSRSELCSVKVSQNTNSIQSLQGLGVNLDYVPLNNYVKNPSFESEKVFDTFVVSDAKDEYIFMTPEEQEGLILNEQALIGSLAKLYTIDERGVMNLIVESPITDYVEASFGSYEELEDTNWLWTQDSFDKVVSYQNVLSGITNSGNLVSDIASESLSKLTSVEEKFVAIDSSDICVYAVTESGVLYYSNDGKNFVLKALIDERNPVYKEISEGKTEISDVCAFKDKAVVLLSDGRLLICSDNEVKELNYFDSPVKFVTSSDNSIMVVLSNGKIYESSNALVYSENKEATEMVGSSLTLDIASNKNTNAVLLSNDTVVSISDDIRLIQVEENTTSINIIENSILGVTEDGEIYISTDTVNTVLSGSDKVYDRVFSCDSGEVLLVENGKLYKTNVFIGIKLEQHIPEESVYAGDICCIEKPVGACQGYVYFADQDSANDYWKLTSQVMSWDIYGNGTSVTTVDEAPVGFGQKCAKILGTTDDYHVISQKIANTGSEIFVENSFLRLELQLMQTDLQSRNIKVWLSSEGCENIGFVIDECTNKFKAYSNVFIASDEMLASENEIRLNIAFEGDGEVLVDGVYLGLDKYSEAGIPEEFTNVIEASTPSVIRLNNLGIGSFGISYESLFSSSANSNATYISDVGLVNNCNSLEESLRLVKDSGAFPWFVIGSSVDQSSVDAFLDYLCGSVTSEYGKKRIDNGTAVPWSRQFSNVIFEINDSDNIFLSDVQRSAYVNYVVGLFKQSSYYKNFKDNIVFLDGMNYDGGSMLSFADYHCTSYVDDGIFDTGVTYIESTNSMYREINAMTPRVRMTDGQSGEYLSSIDFLSGYGDSTVTLGECVVSLLADESSFARMILIDINVEYNETDYTKLLSSNEITMLRSLNVLGFTNLSRRMFCEVQKPLSETPQVTLEQFNMDVGLYLFKNGNEYYLVAANASDKQAQFFVDGKDISVAGTVISRYASDGKLLQEDQVNRLKNRYTIQSGQVIVFRFAEED